MKLSRVHICFSQHLNEQKPKHCRCRKRVSLAEATQMVEKGFAQWLVYSQTTAVEKEICPICINGKFKKGCQNCKSSGEIEKSYLIKVLSTDIVLISSGSTDDNNRIVYRSVKANKTPRVATIEKAHIERAYIYDNKEEQERIEAYGLMTLEARIEMGIGVEPPDDPKTGTGRKYDTGRTPFARISDERTTLGVGKIGVRIREGFKVIDEDGEK